MKNLYGVTPWGAWFVDVLESYQMGSRLDRGRTYANTGRVLSLLLTSGRALARVEGNFRPFYRVEISFPPLEEAAQVYRMIRNDPSLLAHIAAGELPETFLQRLKEQGIDLIPPRWSDMKRFCSCPDENDPCKHMAALYYIIAKEIDADPHVLFRLRGMDLSTRFGRAAVHKITPPFTVKCMVEEKKSAQKKPKPKKPKVEPISLEEIPHCAELITALLPSSPPFYTRDFTMVMAEFYHQCAHYQAWESVETEINSEMEHNFSRSVWTLVCPKPAPGSEVFLDARDINGEVRSLTVYDAFEHFVQFSSEDGTASYSFLFYLFKFLNLLCSSGAFIPYILATSGTLEIIWRPFETLPSVAGMLEALAVREGGSLAGLRALERDPSILYRPGFVSGMQILTGRSVVDLIAAAFLTEWVHKRMLAFNGSFNKHGAGNEYRELLGMFFSGASIDISSPARRSLPAAIDRWLSVLHINFAAYRYSLTIREPRLREDGEGFYFSLSMEVQIEESGKIRRTSISRCRKVDMLRAPIALSNYLPEIRELVSSAPEALRTVQLSEARLVAFLDSAAPLLTRLGMTINLPRSLAKELKPRLVIKGSPSASSLVHYLDLEALHDFEWQIAIGDTVMSLAEFKSLVKEKRELVRFNDGFLKMSPEEFSRLLKRAKNTAPNLNDFLKAYFSGDTVLAFDAREIIDNLFREHDYPVPAALKAELRPYQKRGYNWVCSLLLSGFGCILADDMGLGKTVQSIAVLLRFKEEGFLDKAAEGYHGCLIIAPATLLNNWEKEFSRFAPSINVSRYHGHNRILNRNYDVFLTTYQTAVRDAAKLKSIAFSLLIVDEAHLMKNAETRLAKTVKQVRSQYRLALSGTPVENRLEDLRSLFDFILPGYLGNAADFKKQYRIPIEVMRSREQADILQRITSPFLLRRLKTDKKIIEDLPEKIVANEYAVLEKEQAALYESVVAESIRKSEKSDPEERIALILSLLTSLKQICNHPRVFDKESPAVSALSGKAQLLITLLREMLTNREKILIFSQYVETLDCLERIIKRELGEAALVYHGSLGQNARTEIINQFQSDPLARILLVSLKAGGLGLNLTAASRVIHYDLWYNPAVENQATDRAFRIGQKRTVFVHRFITKNSFEEKIDAMISSKQELVDMTITSGESWLARMSHEELKSLFDR
ncbi:MAG: SNF2-related protein [Treponema sp.]|nr:SNF2-related protein [Treponema sp.]